MQYESFKKYIADNVKSFLPTEYENYEVDIVEQRKNNNVFWDALSIKGEKNIMPVIYLEPYYHKYENGEKLENILQSIADTYMKSMEQVGEFPADRFQYDRVKDGIFVVAQNAEMNRDLLENVPHEIREDLALLYRVSVELSNGEKGSVLINNAHLDLWGIDERTLKEVAWSNMHHYRRPVFSSMNDILGELGFDEIPEQESLMEMYVLSNEEKYYGAAYVFDEDTMSRIADRLNSDIVIIPSSIHETILLKKMDDMDFESLKEMVREVNRTQLHPTEILSDEVYQYDRETQTLSRVMAAHQEEYILPDKVSLEEMHEYGYKWDGMLPLTKERALELMDTELQIYKLDTSGAESMLESKEGIQKHDGLFGVEKEAWISYLNAQSQEQTGGMVQGM